MDYKVVQYIWPEFDLQYVLPFMKPNIYDEETIKVLKDIVVSAEGFTEEELDEIILYAVLTNDPNDVQFIQNNPSLCKQCGWCCKHVDYILLTGEDIQRIGSTDNIEVYDDKYMQMKTPCIYLKDNKCTIYDKRPNSCRTFPINIKNLELVVQRPKNCEMVIGFLVTKIMSMCSLVERKRKKEKRKGK